MKFFLMIVLLNALVAGGWTKKKGSVFLKLDTRYLKATQLYNSIGSKVDIPTFKSFYTSVYGEYGLSDTFTFVGKLPYSSHTMNAQESEFGTPLSSGEKNSGFGDMSLGFRYGLDQEGSFVTALYYEAELPTGDDSHSSGLFTGDGELNHKINLEAGISFGNNGYSVAAIGYNLRGDDFSNEFLIHLEYGVNVTSSILTAVKLRGAYPVNDLNTGNFSQAFQQSEYTALSVEANYFLSKTVGATLAYETAFRVKNNFVSPVVSLGFFYSM